MSPEWPRRPSHSRPAPMANRIAHSRFLGTTPGNWTLSGTQLSGRLAATSVIVSGHRSSRRSVSRSVIRAVADGLTFASKTSSSPGTQLCTTVLSSMTAGHVPIECRMRAPGAGHSNPRRRCGSY